MLKRKSVFEIENAFDYYTKINKVQKAIAEQDKQKACQEYRRLTDITKKEE